MAQIATGNAADALDIVQDSMFKLVEKYSDKPEDEWAPLFIAS
jgi:RNA polymerase sigma-70 factor (ECF subfamily)